MHEELERQRSGDLSDEDFCASDVQFHRALVNGTGNPMLQFVMFSVIEALQPVMNLLLYRFSDHRVIVDQHARILDALEARDGDLAQAVLREQMAYLREQFVAAQEWQRSRQSESGE